MHSLVVCIGNRLAGDDGVGASICDELAGIGMPDEARLLFLGLGGLDILDHLQGEELMVVVDAVQLGRTPGTVHVLDWQDIPVTGTRPVSGHGIGIREAIEVGRRLYADRMPEKIVLVGIEGEVFDQLGVPLSGKVQAAVPVAVQRVRELVE